VIVIGRRHNGLVNAACFARAPNSRFDKREATGVE
jgi:hypothetical protein